MTIKRDYIQIQYSLAQFLFWVTACTCSGFVAVYLQYKGLSNTLVGLVVGIYSLLSLLAQPLTAEIVARIPFLTVKKMLVFLMILMGVMFGVITFLHLPLLVVIILFVAVNGINGAVNPMLNTFGIEYVNQNRRIDFSIARGIGSMGWAVTAVFLGALLVRFTPDILGYVYIISAVAMLIILFTMEDLGQAVKNHKSDKKETGVLKAIVSNPVMLWVAVGLFFLLSSHSIGTTFTINIVRNVGGTELTAGIAQFFAAGSELAGMVICSVLMKRLNSLQILKISAAFFILRFTVLLFAPSIPWVFFSYALQVASTGFYIPAAVYFVNERMAVEKQTQGQSVFYMLTGGLSACVATFLGGWLQDRFGLQATIMTCIICGVIGLICIGTQRAKNKK